MKNHASDHDIIFIRCPWCASNAPVQRDRIAPHKVGPRKCVGIGQPMQDAQELNHIVLAGRNST